MLSAANAENWSQMADLMKTHLVPTHTDSSRVRVVLESPAICHARSPLGNWVIPQNMRLIDGVSSLP